VDSSYLIQAISECQEALATKETPDWQVAFRNLGNLLQGMGQFDRAIVWHSLALENQPALAEVYCHLGGLYLLEKNWSEALTCFQNALEYQPNSAQIYANLAQIYGQLQQREAEMECWYRATKLNPDLVNSKGYYKLGKALEQKGRMDEAIACYQQASQGKNSLLAATYELAEISLRQGKLERARANFEQVLQSAPHEANAQYKLGTIYFQERRFQEAIDCFRQTIKNAPDFPLAYRDLVKTFLQLKQWDEAIATCYAIINLVEPYPWVYVHLGNAFREKGQIAEAAANFRYSCASYNWHLCLENGYFFTYDFFSFRIPTWQVYLQPLLDKEELKIIEVGSHQGMSSCWLLDNILIHPEDKLICIEPQFAPKLKENITRTGVESKVTFLAGDVHKHLNSLEANSIDLINFQDKCKQPDYIEACGILSWKLLKKDGILVFNDYGWVNPAVPEQQPKLGIDRFLESIKDEWELVHRVPQAFQLIIRKRSQ
jgi:tetratricopeptide (TPR) repeat protein/predicted O-methyltransferase YrrM